MTPLEEFLDRWGLLILGIAIFVLMLPQIPKMNEQINFPDSSREREQIERIREFFR